MAANLGFRTDINGIRALAVTAVLVYHFTAAYLPGGFAGVDVFFVISGFLMTSIIINKIQQHKFSLVGFYLARFRRIVPPLVVMCSALAVFGWFFFPPSYFESMHKHIAGSIGFISNILYMRESGYFDVSSQEKWLLHTWSLSVEWQFYIIYPVVLLAFAKIFGLARLKVIIVIITVLAFFFCIYHTHTNPNAAFYLLPARAWEMLLGSIAFFYPLHLKPSLAKKVQYSGIALIITSYFFMSHDMAWPSFWAIVPTLGALVILLANYEASVLNTNSVVQKLGKASYSIYLWHWPVTVVFFTLGWVHSIEYLLLGLIISLILGFIAYYAIEVKMADFLGKKIVGFTIIVATLVFSFSAYVHINGDFENRLSNSPITNISPSPKRESCNVLRGKYKNPQSSCEYFGNEITWATLGDSHSIEIAYALAESLKPDDIGVKQYSASACPPLFNVETTLKACGKWSSEALTDLMKAAEIQNVVVAYRYSSILFGDNANTYPEIPDEKPKLFKNIQGHEARDLVMETLITSIHRLAEVKQKVFFVLPIAELGENINKQALRAILSGNKSSLLSNVSATSKDYYNKRHAYFYQKLASVQFKSNVVFIDPSKQLCNEQSCFSFIDGEPMYFDDDHVSVVGASMIVEQILNADD